MNRLTICLFVLFQICTLYGFAQSCADIYDKATKYRLSSNFDDNNDYSFTNQVPTNVDSAIYYNKLLIKLDSCKELFPKCFSRLAFLSYLNNNYKEAKFYADKLLSINSTKTIKWKNHIFINDTLVTSKFDTYKILGRIYLKENNEDSVIWISKKVDSLKSKVCFCSTCNGRQNWYLKELESQMYVNKKQYNDALQVWKSIPRQGNEAINRKVISILKEKYGDKLKERFTVGRVNEDEYSTSTYINVDDEIICLILVIQHDKCDDSIEKCLSKIDYLTDIYMQK